MKKTLVGFKQFILRGNVIDLAVGIMIGAAFGALVNSLVADILTPLIATIFSTPDFSGLTLVIGEGKITYGNFFNAVISFLLVAVAIYFFVVTPVNKVTAKMKKEEEKKESKPSEELLVLREIRDSLKINKIR